MQLLEMLFFPMLKMGKLGPRNYPLSKTKIGSASVNGQTMISLATWP